MVWTSVLASVAFTVMCIAVMQEDTIATLFCCIVYVTSLFVGVFYESNQKEKIEKMEKEIKELKKYVKRNAL